MEVYPVKVPGTRTGRRLMWRHRSTGNGDIRQGFQTNRYIIGRRWESHLLPTLICFKLHLERRFESRQRTTRNLETQETAQWGTDINCFSDVCWDDLVIITYWIGSAICVYIPDGAETADREAQTTPVQWQNTNASSDNSFLVDWLSQFLNVLRPGDLVHDAQDLSRPRTGEMKKIRMTEQEQWTQRQRENDGLHALSNWAPPLNMRYFSSHECSVAA